MPPRTGHPVSRHFSGQWHAGLSAGPVQSRRLVSTKPSEGSVAQRTRMCDLARAQPRFGYLRIWVLLRREGWRVNRKRKSR